MTEEPRPTPSPDEPVSRFYVTVDALFDTRLGTLFKVAPDRVTDILANGYLDRECDSFAGVDQAVYDEAYKNRDKATLLNSPMTEIYKTINRFVHSTLMARIDTPYVTKPAIEINLYPYKLTERECGRLLKGVEKITGERSDIGLIYEPIDFLTASVVKQRYIALFLYEHWEWLETVAKADGFKTETCYERFMYGPAIVRSTEVFKTHTPEQVFDAIEAYTKMFIKFSLLPVSEYSLSLSRISQLIAK